MSLDWRRLFGGESRLMRAIKAGPSHGLEGRYEFQRALLEARLDVWESFMSRAGAAPGESLIFAFTDEKSLRLQFPQGGKTRKMLGKDLLQFALQHQATEILINPGGFGANVPKAEMIQVLEGLHSIASEGKNQSLLVERVMLLDIQSPMLMDWPAGLLAGAVEVLSKVEWVESAYHFVGRVGPPGTEHRMIRIHATPGTPQAQREAVSRAVLVRVEGQLPDSELLDVMDTEEPPNYQGLKPMYAKGTT